MANEAAATEKAYAAEKAQIENDGRMSDDVKKKRLESLDRRYKGRMRDLEPGTDERSR
jgi:hypothetical protein